MKSRLFPRKFKFVGIILVLFAFPLTKLIYNHVIELPLKDEISMNILKGLVLAGFLLMILSKEKIEDEFIDSCRLLAFRASFLSGLVVYIVNVITGDEPTSSFNVLFFQSLLYLSFFYTFKKGVIKW